MTRGRSGPTKAAVPRAPRPTPRVRPTAAERRLCDRALSLVAASAVSSEPSWAAREGFPYPLGVSWMARENAYNFALYSKHAERVSLDCARARHRVPQALGEDGVGEEDGRGRAVAHRVSRADGGLAEHAGSEVLLGILEVHLLGDRDAVVADEGSSPPSLDEDAARLRPQGDANRVGQDGGPREDLGPGLVSEEELGVSHGVRSSSPASDRGNERAIASPRAVPAPPAESSVGRSRPSSGDGSEGHREGSKRPSKAASAPGGARARARSRHLACTPWFRETRDGATAPGA